MKLFLVNSVQSKWTSFVENYTKLLHCMKSGGKNQDIKM